MVEAVPAVAAVVFAVCESEGGPASHAYIGVRPLWGLSQGSRSQSVSVMDIENDDK